MTEKQLKLWRKLERRRPGMYLHPAVASGRYQVGYLDESSGRWTPLFEKDNLLLYTWGYLAARTLGQGDVTYKVSTAYLEYQNVAAPGDAVAVPSFTRASDISYYNGLGAGRDFLRVALTGTPSIDIHEGYESYFSAGTGNRVTFVLQSAGTAGVLGRPFSHLNNSKACGIALVATPVEADRSQDVILARGYFEVADQPLKVNGSQIGVRWKVSFQ